MAAATSSNAGLDRADDRGGLVGPADRAARSASMSASAVSTSGANTTSTGTPSERSFSIASGGLKLLPPAITRSVPRATIFSTSTEPNLATSGTARGLGRVGGEVLDLADDAVADAEREQGLGRGGGERRRSSSGSAGIVTAVPSSSVSVDREGGAAVGVGGRGRGRRGGRRPTGRAWPGAAAAVGARAAGASRRRGRRPARSSRAGNGWAATGPSRGSVRPRELRTAGWKKQETPRFGVEARGQAVDRTMRLTFLSKARAATAGRRPDFRPGGRSP